MSRQDLNDFINQVGQINAMFLPGAISADGAGGISSAQELVYELKKKSAALGRENIDTKELKKEIEGVLLTMQSMNLIDSSTLDSLLAKLSKI